MPRDASALSPEVIRRTSADLGVHLSDEQSAQLAGFAALLVKWNRVHNLTSVDKPSEVLTHHLLDSLSIVPEVARVRAGRSLRILDVGAGGGLPGFPLAIAMPEVQVTEIDRIQKKAAFLQQARLELGLANIEVVNKPVEDYRARPFDLIVSRGFAALAQMVRLTSHLIGAQGRWAAMKGVYPAEEIDALPPTVKFVSAVKLRVPLLGAERHLVILCPR